MNNRTWEFWERERCSICGWPTATADIMDHTGALGCCICRRWAKDEGRKAAEGALTRGLQNEVDRMIDSFMAEMDRDAYGRD